jgi:preprotein translocase subunit SecF
LVQLWAPARSLSVWALAALLLATVLFATRGLNLAVEFTGGMLVYAHAPAGLGLVEEALIEVGVGDVAVLKKVSGQPSDVLILVPHREDLFAPQSASLLAQQVTSALQQRRVDVNGIEIIAASVGSELLRIGAVPPILAFVAAVVFSAFRYGRRHALSAAVVTLGAIAIVLGLVLSVYIAFRWEFSLSSLMAVDGLAILAAVVSAVYLSRTHGAGLLRDTVVSSSARL